MKRGELNVILTILIVILLVLTGIIWDSREIMSNTKLIVSFVACVIGLIISILTISADPIKE